jgi:hypothetical protein
VGDAAGEHQRPTVQRRSQKKQEKNLEFHFFCSFCLVMISGLPPKVEYSGTLHSRPFINVVFDCAAMRDIERDEGIQNETKLLFCFACFLQVRKQDCR